MAVEATYWMDRIKKAEPAPKRVTAIRLVENKQESRALIVAKAALLGRVGMTQEELYKLANERRRADMTANRPHGKLLALGLTAAGVAVSVAGNVMGHQLVLLGGFTLLLAGAVTMCMILAAMLRPQIGDLAGYIRPEEAPANAEEISALSKAVLADAELDKLTGNWWKEHGAPIRRQDLALAKAFVAAKAVK